MEAAGILLLFVLLAIGGYRLMGKVDVFLNTRVKQDDDDGGNAHDGN